MSKLNLASICLIPKKDDPKLVSNYRPISLINCSFKLITKALTKRLSTVISSLIDPSQTAFIKGRLITDNIASAHEVLHQVRKKRLKGVLFKLDYEKAFDRVHWDFLIEILKARGFGTQFISWIHAILFKWKIMYKF